MNFSFLRNSVFLLSLSYILPPLLYADFFKWELLVSEKGYGTESLKIPIVAEGKIDFIDENFICSMRNFWTINLIRKQNSFIADYLQIRHEFFFFTKFCFVAVTFVYFTLFIVR